MLLITSLFAPTGTDRKCFVRPSRLSPEIPLWRSNFCRTQNIVAGAPCLCATIRYLLISSNTKLTFCIFIIFFVKLFLYCAWEIKMSNHKNRTDGPRVPPPEPELSPKEISSGDDGLRWYLLHYCLPIAAVSSLIGLFIGTLINPKQAQPFWDWIFTALALIF